VQRVRFQRRFLPFFSNSLATISHDIWTKEFTAPMQMELMAHDAHTYLKMSISTLTRWIIDHGTVRAFNSSEMVTDLNTPTTAPRLFS
jgi:hypothetical protein